MLDANTMRVVNKITLSFPNLHEDILVDEYRAYYLKVLHDGNLIAFGAYFSDEDALDENIGLTMMFFLGKLQRDSTTESLNSQAYFWGEMNHVSDDTDKLPMIKLDYIECGDQCLCIAQQNQIDSPFIFLVQNGKLDVCYQDPSFPKVDLPYVDADRQLKDTKEGGELMDAIDAKGACLGFTVFKSQMTGAPRMKQMMTKDEEREFQWPPFIFLMQLDGTVKWYEFYNTQWSDKSLLYDSKLPKAGTEL